MYFQHYVAEDFVNHQHLLHKKINIQDLDTLIKSIDTHLVVIPSSHFDGETLYSIDINRPGYMLIHGKSINKVDRVRKYNSFKAWLDLDGFPVVVNVNNLRADQPELNMMSDLQLALFVYGATYPLAPVNESFNFNDTDDYIKLFITGYEEYGVADDFDRSTVTFTKLRYLINQGRQMEVKA